MGFLPDVERIIRKLPEYRQTLLFSATIASEVNRLAQQYMHKPIDVAAESYVDPRKLAQFYYGPVQDSLKYSLLVHLINQDKDRNKDGLSMIFTNTRRYADILERNLVHAGINATALHGGFSQHERSKRLRNFHDGRNKILVATDVAARGLDIQGVTTVFNYDLPENHKQYIHRIGRTARAGKAGKAVTIVSQKDNEKFYYMFRDHRLKIQKNEIPYVKRVQTPRRKSDRSNGGRRPNGNSRSYRNRQFQSSPSRPQSSRYSL
jgi:ATP-dependent RNA helicase DeaD